MPKTASTPSFSSKIGLPELADRLALRKNRSLLSRLHTRLRIEPLVHTDTAEYHRLRLRRAGCDRDLLEKDALALLHEATLGSMRDLDRLAIESLRLAALKKRRLIDRDLVSLALDGHPLARSHGHQPACTATGYQAERKEGRLSSPETSTASHCSGVRWHNTYVHIKIESRITLHIIAK